MLTRSTSLINFFSDEGRDPKTFGIEAWIRFGDGNPEVWMSTAKKWLTLGADHLTFYTSGQGAGDTNQQIEEMRKFYEVCKSL